MKQVNSSRLGLAHLLAQIGKVGGKNGWR
jgi:hypothetical protein